MKKKDRLSRGFTLVEVVAYTALVSVLVISMFTFVSRGFYNVNEKQDKIILSQELDLISKYISSQADKDCRYADIEIGDKSIKYKAVDSKYTASLVTNKIYYEETTKKIMHQRVSGTVGNNVIAENVEDFNVEEKDGYIVISITKSKSYIEDTITVYLKR